MTDAESKRIVQLEALAMAEMANAETNEADEVERIVKGLRACPDVMDVETKSLGGALVTASFVDSHLHLLTGGRMMAELNMAKVTSKAQFIDRVRQRAMSLKSGEWVIGGRWSDAMMGGAWPDKSWIDEAIADVDADINVWLSRADMHAGVASRGLLQLAGVTKETIADVNAKLEGTGVFDVGADGEPTGVVREKAMGLLKELIAGAIGADDLERRRAWRDAATAYLHSVGVTAAHDMGDGVSSEESVDVIWTDATVLHAEDESKRDAGTFVRVAAAVPLTLAERLAAHVATHGSLVSDKLRLGSVKAFADGSLGSRTALFHAPYKIDGKETDNHGMRVVPLAQLTNAALGAAALGLQLIIHAIGDAAIDDVVGIYARAEGSEDGGRLGHRIEHVQHVTLPAAETANRIAAVNATAAVQPLQLLFDREVAEDVLGEEVASASSYTFARMQDAGVRLAFGSDWPVVDADPMQAIYAAVHRRAPSVSRAWLADEALDVESCWRAHTIQAARAMRWDDDIGSLVENKLADFVTLPANAMDAIRAGEPVEILSTFVGGVCVYGCE